jgi:hypothetical protein
LLDRRFLVQLEIVRFRDLLGHGLRHALDVNFRADLAGALGDGFGHRFDVAVG